MVLALPIGRQRPISAGLGAIVKREVWMTMSRNDLLTASPRVPEHVVFREFPSETVLLNLQTGRYHGLNPIGGRMLLALERENSVATAAAALGEEYDQPVATVQHDLLDLCEELLERGLIEVDA
jgi:hypothetical protein